MRENNLFNQMLSSKENFKNQELQESLSVAQGDRVSIKNGAKGRLHETLTQPFRMQVCLYSTQWHCYERLSSSTQ